MNVRKIGRGGSIVNDDEEEAFFPYEWNNK
jgi:hypothetical protein